jgi:HD superfamily phosphohydrolase YqeK
VFLHARNEQLEKEMVDLLTKTNLIKKEKIAHWRLLHSIAGRNERQFAYGLEDHTTKRDLYI